MMKHLWRGLSFRIIFGTVLLLLVFGWILSAIGYVRFTSSLTKEYNDAAFRTAETAATLIDGDKIDRWQTNNGTDEDYILTAQYIDILCERQNVTMIYVIDVDTTDYGRFTSIFNSVARDSSYTPWPLGYERDTTNNEYRNIYRDIYENGLERGTLLRLNQLRGKEPHITSLVPVKKADGSVRAILCVQRPMAELVEGRRLYLLYVAIATLIASVLVVMSSFFFLRHQFVKPMKKITAEASRFAAESTLSKEGELSEISRIREIDILAQSIERMEKDMLGYIDNLTTVTAEKERIGTELAIAAQIQTNMLPKTFPAFPQRDDMDIYAVMKPAKEMGGDFYDFFFLDDRRLALVIADVSGKGIPAAMFMVVSRTLIKKQAQSGGVSTADILQAANEQICEDNTDGLFVTVWLAIIDLKTGEGLVSNAGHEFPALKKQDDDFKLLRYKHSPPLGALEGLKFEEHKILLDPGDEIFVYTDGVPEAVNENIEQYGNDRMLEALNAKTDNTPKGRIENVMASLDKFVGQAKQFDDTTMLCFKYFGI